MTVLVIGASGATGRLLVRQLLNRGQPVRAIVRSSEKFLEIVEGHEHLSVIQASIHDISDGELAQHVKECDTVASCLGHNLSFKGVFGQPRQLVSDTTRRLCKALWVNNPKSPSKFVLMSSTGCRNHDLKEPVSFAERCVVGLLRILIPPQADNERAAEHLRRKLGQDNSVVEWAAVRPDSLTDENEVSPYELHPSPTRSAIFNSGKTSRINVAHFMADLITDSALWNTWKGKMPVIYNKT